MFFDNIDFNDVTDGINDGFDHSMHIHDNILGGHDFNDIHSEPNIFGGDNFYEHGVHTGHSEPNIFGGMDYFNEHNHLETRTMDDGIGGEHIYVEGAYDGHISEDLSGHFTFTGADGDSSFISTVDTGNAHAILSYDDPLAHINAYTIPDLFL